MISKSTPGVQPENHMHWLRPKPLPLHCVLSSLPQVWVQTQTFASCRWEIQHASHMPTPLVPQPHVKPWRTRAACHPGRVEKRGAGKERVELRISQHTKMGPRLHILTVCTRSSTITTCFPRGFPSTQHGRHAFPLYSVNPISHSIITPLITTRR